MARAERLIDALRTIGWGPECNKAYADLVKAAAEESYIVKAARVLAGSPYPWTALELDSDLGRLIAEVARAGAAPYEVGTGTETENDWVAPLRAELTQRNK